MASVGVSAAAAAYSWNPFLAAGAIAVASYLDQQYLYPAILGDGKEQARPKPLIGLPTTTNTPGSPRVWALGRRVRVPAHIMYQSEKEREETITGPKGGVASQIKRVFADVGLSINDRQTAKLTQLVANGQLIYWRDKNLVQVTSSNMTCSFNTTTLTTGTTAGGSTTTTIVSTAAATTANYYWIQITSGPLSGQARPIVAVSGNNYIVEWPFGSAPGAGVTFSVIRKQLVLTMDTNYEQDFQDYFVLNDVVDLRGFVASPTSVDIQGRSPWGLYSWWRVKAITGHGATPSSITLDAISEQNIGPITSVEPGSAFVPASVVREDAYFLTTNEEETWDTGGTQTSSFRVSASNQDYLNTRAERFLGTNVQPDVRLWNFQYSNTAVPPGNWNDVPTTDDYSLALLPVTTGGAVKPAAITGTGVGFHYGLRTKRGRAGIIKYPVDPTYEGRMFVSDPGEWFFTGNEEQTENGIILKTKSTGQVPGYRGLAYQMLEQWDLSTYFGNQVPPIVEAIIEPDSLMTIPQAILEICERAQSQDLKFDTSGVNVAPFEGYWTQGAIPTVTALQPLLTAYQVAAQERNDTLVFFNIENADIVQIENGATFSDLGVTSGADTPFAGDKIKITQRDIADLPTSIGVTHQDPDQQYSQGYQHFKQRQPSPLPSVNEQNINLDNIVLSRKQARNLAGTIMRRAWVNATALEFQLPVAYMELLENDLITLTTDPTDSSPGQDFTARIIRREIGNNFVVNVYAVVEDVALAVRGSPVQGPSDIVIGTPSPVAPAFRVLDVPPLVDGDAFVPGYYVGGSSPAWQGAIVYESRDAGANWIQVATLNTQCGMGLTTTSLASGTPGDGIGLVTFDTVNSVTVAVDNLGPTGFLITVTETDVRNGWNWMLIQDGANWEILGARDVLDNGDGTYTLSHLLRGLRGTYDSAATTKAAGSKVTFLYQARQLGALQFVPVNLSAANFPASIQVKVVASGQSLIDVTAETVSLECWNARPMPGRMFTTELDVGTYDRTFVFDNWTRLQGVVGSGGPYNLDESFEGYQVRIYDPTGATLMRTKTISSATTGTNRIRGDRSVPYPAAEQTADGYTPGPSETFKVERVQLGDFGEGRSWMEDV